MAADGRGAPAPRVVGVGDGTHVGLYDYGDLAGYPVLVFHGVPACGAGFTWADEPARARGLRLLAPDRPGVGLSTARDGWTVADYPAMTAELAAALDLDRFAVWGYSGGGPYAVAVAAGMADRVSALAVAAGMGEIGSWAEPGDFEKTDQQMLGLAVRHPLVARAIMGSTARLAKLSPKGAVKSFAKQLSEADRRVLATLGDPKEAMALFTQAFLNGSRGVVDDYRAISGPWHVAFDAITSPTRIFQGTDDTMVPARHSDELAKRIAGADLVSWPGEGHLATITHVEEILDWLAATRPPT